LPAGQPAPEAPTNYSVTGYAFSRLAGGEQLRPDPVLHGDQDHTYSSPEVADPNEPFTDFVARSTWNPANPANGNLEHAGDYANPVINPNGSLAGWTHHGGGETGRVDFNGSGEAYLELDSENAARTHNWSYVPAYATALEFSFQVSRQNFNNVLRVRVGDALNAFRDFALHPANVPASISVTRFESFERQYVCIPEPLRGNVQTFDFEIVSVNASAAVDAEVRVDDVRYSNTSCEGPSVVEVIDTSGSMDGDKLVAAQESASLFVDLMGDGDRIGVVSYADDAAVKYALTEITDGSDVRQAAKDEINRLVSEGATSIGAGILAADGELDGLTPEEEIRAMIVLTDGNHNTDPDPFDVIDSDVDDDIRIFTIGFGADADEELMREIAERTGGQYYFAPDQATLQQVYVDLAGTVTGQQPIFQQSASIQIGQTIISDFRVDSSVADFTLGVNFPQGDLDIEVVTPTGTVITPSLAASDPNVNHIEGPTYEFVQVNRPPVGVWKIRLTGVDVVPGGVEYDLFARVDSTIRSEIVENESTPTLGNVTNLQVVVDNGLPLLGANVIAHVTNIGIENGVTRSTVLYDDGMHEDGKAGDGVYGTNILLGDEPGTYEVQAKVSGMTIDGETFERFPNETFELRPASSAILPRVLFQSLEGAQVIENDTEVDSQLLVNETFRIADIDIQLDLEYTISADLDIDLIAPDGRRIELVRSDLAERVTAYTQTIFDDDAPTSILDGTQPFTGRFQPVGDLFELQGLPANGTWGLDVTDDIDNGIGTLKSWSITIVGQPLSVTPLTFIDNGQPMPAGATLDFGVAYEGTLAPTRPLAVRNNGTEPLALSGLGLPAGFELVGAPFGELPPGSTASFAVRLETSMVTHTEGSSELIVGEVPNYPVPFTLDLKGSVVPMDSSLWNNFAGHTDVDNDGFTTARDALLIINDLVARGGRDLPPAPPAFSTPYFIDVTNDFLVSAQDVLQVINEINAPTRNSPQGIPVAATISQEIPDTQRQSPGTRLEVDDTARQMSTDLLMANVAVYTTSANGDYRSTDQRGSLLANDKAVELDAELDAVDGWLPPIG
jgi:Mg-chelatase subunit ChlD/subtilisin-like proprotein convertase family protein